jgi:hypothetical protein
MIELIYRNTRQKYQVKYIVRRTPRSSEGRRRPSRTPPQVRADDAPKERLKTIKRSLHNCAKVRKPTLGETVMTRGTERAGVIPSAVCT